MRSTTMIATIMHYIGPAELGAMPRTILALLILTAAHDKVEIEQNLRALSTHNIVVSFICPAELRTKRRSWTSSGS